MFRYNVIATGGDFLEKNENEFRIYRKYEAESTISFDDADLPPLPDDKTKETVDPQTKKDEPAAKKK